jgi:pimeloyl-ACP methyl ester carboxylesterase
LILVHGWQELAIIGFRCNKPYSSTWQTFLEEFALDPAIADQFQVFSLGYSTSNSISVVGEHLAEILQAQFGQDPSYVVAHSMGGVVARAALINEKANINGLVMLATPNHGTPIASQETVDLFGTGVRYKILDFIIGGEGIKDLAWDNFDNILQYNDRRGNPGNPVLKRLNDEDTNFGRYAVFAGNGYSFFGALIHSYLYDDLGYENDTVVPVPSALFYSNDSVQDSRLKQQKLYEGLSHLNIMDDEQVLADTRGALLDFLATLPTPILGISDGATSVSVNSIIETSFIRPIFGSTLNTSTFQIAGPDGAVMGTIAYNTHTYTAIFTPSSPLAYNTRYTATITTGIKDTLANSMDSNFSWSFTTELAVNPAPAGYVQFEEGDPGIEGDGIFVESSEVGISRISNESLTIMDPKPLIGADRDGTTITVFTKLPSDQEFDGLKFEFGYLGTSCLLLLSDNDIVRGLTTLGEATYFNYRYYLVTSTERVRRLTTSPGNKITNTSGCSNATVSNMFLNRIEFVKFGPGVYPDPVKVDAVTVDSGLVRR